MSRAVIVPAAVPCPAKAAEKKTFLVPMRNGVRLATDVYGAEAGARKPVLLMRTPCDFAGLLPNCG